MNLTMIKNNQESDQMDKREDHYMKLEALNYLKKVLINEDFANGQYIVQIAFKYGAQQIEIDNIFNRYAGNKNIERYINSWFTERRTKWKEHMLI